MSWTRIAEGLHRWTDTCNVYALAHEGRALLIDCGAGDALDHLGELEVEGVDWVLYTHHHREQCQGHARLTASGAKTAAPVGEAKLMRDPASLWDDLDANTVYGAVHARPPREPVSIDRTLAPLDTFEWGPFAIQVYATPGNTQGSVTYRARIAGEWFLFSGDLILAGGTMHTFYDNEWDYGHSLGPKTMCQSLTYLRALLPATVCPAHGPVIADPEPDIRGLHATLDRFDKDWYTRAWDWNDGIGGAMEWFSQPTAITGVRRFTDNLYKLGRMGSNCYLLIGETGRGMFVDCGGQSPAHLDHALEGLRDEAGLRTIEVLIPTHVHGDHYGTLGYLREKWGAEVWCLDAMAEAMERPYRFNSSALAPYYRFPFETIPIARKLTDRERFEWDGLELVAHDLPGQTCYTTGVQLRVEDKRVMFTGDNIFHTSREGRSGHEAILARNGSRIDLQYLAGAERLAEVNPDWILAGHSSEIEDARRQIPLFLEWARAMPGKFAELSSHEAYELFLDPYWMRLDPWMQRLAPGDEARVQVIVRSHHPDGTRFVIEPRLPECWEVEPAAWEGTLARGEQARFELRFRVPADAPSRTHIISADLTCGDERWGEFFDARVDVIGNDVTPPRWYDRVK